MLFSNPFWGWETNGLWVRPFFFGRIAIWTFLGHPKGHRPCWETNPCLFVERTNRFGLNTEAQRRSLFAAATPIFRQAKRAIIWESPWQRQIKGTRPKTPAMFAALQCKRIGRRKLSGQTVISICEGELSCCSARMLTPPSFPLVSF